MWEKELFIRSKNNTKQSKTTSTAKKDWEIDEDNSRSNNSNNNNKHQNKKEIIANQDMYWKNKSKNSSSINQ